MAATSARFLERYVVTEEMRVANAPTRRFFVADRQSGPVLLKYAPEHIKMDILPRICRGEVCFAIGMSEPNSGSDLFAAKTKATKTDGGYLINGTKIWTSSAHIADYMIAIFRTSPPTKENRRHGLTQFLVDMKTAGHPGESDRPDHRPVRIQRGGVHRLLSCPTITCSAKSTAPGSRRPRELAYERSGPERFLETYYVLTELVRAVGQNPDTRSAEGIGRLVAQLHTMRRMSVSVAGMLQAGKEPVVEASIVKDIGTVWEQQLPHRVRDLAAFVEAERHQPRDAGEPAVVRDQDRAEADHPGRHHRSAARHHRARARAALRRPARTHSTRKPHEQIHGHRRREARPRRHHRNPAAAAELLRHLADQPDRRRAGGVRQGYRDPRLGAGGAGQGVLRRRQFQRSERGRSSEAAEAKGDPADSLGSIDHLYMQAVRIFRAKKPIVAAVQGAAIGGGLGLAVSADFRVTCPEARFSANFTKLGFHPGFGLTVTLPELVGKNNAELMFYTSRRVTGEEATKMGLANVLVPQDQVRAAAHEARARRSPSARRSACSRPAPPCAPASPTACSPPPITNSPSRPGCARPKTSRKASRPPPSAASRTSRGGELLTHVVPAKRHASAEPGPIRARPIGEIRWR